MDRALLFVAVVVGLAATIAQQRAACELAAARRALTEAATASGAIAGALEIAAGAQEHAGEEIANRGGKATRAVLRLNLAAPYR